MSLYLIRTYKDAYPYYTNLDYLYNMTWLQMNPLKEMEWIEFSKYIRTGLWPVPWITFSKEDVEYSVESFMKHLNEELRGL
jgi:hypothetical protein